MVLTFNYSVCSSYENPKGELNKGGSKGAQLVWWPQEQRFWGTIPGAATVKSSGKREVGGMPDFDITKVPLKFEMSSSTTELCVRNGGTFLSKQHFSTWSK